MTDSEKISRLSRLTAILLKLQTRSFVSVHYLAEQFDVSIRTIYRDLASLEQAGVPLVAMEKRRFGLMDGYNVPPVMFTESEANALIIAEKIIQRTKDESLIQEFSKATDKIKSVLGHDEKDKASFLAERTIIGRNWDNIRNSTYLTEIQQALTHFQVLKIEYQNKSDSKSTRTIEPFAIYNNTSENWVLIAWCRLRNDFRTFRVDRIQKLQKLPETFPPHQISLTEYVEMQKKRHWGENS